MKVHIGRINSPLTDLVSSTDFTAEEIETMKDVLAIINGITNGKDQWFLVVDDGPVVVPITEE